MTFLVLNQQKIDEWKAGLLSLQQDNLQREKEILLHTQKFQELKPLFLHFKEIYEKDPECTLYRNEIAELQEKKNALEDDISDLESKVTDEEDDIAHTEQLISTNTLNGIAHSIHDAINENNSVAYHIEDQLQHRDQLNERDSHTNNIKLKKGLILIHKNRLNPLNKELLQLQATIAEKEEKYHELKAAKNYHERLKLMEVEKQAIIEAKRFIELNNQEIVNYQNNIETAKEYIKRLREKPEELFSHLQKRLIKFFTHPSWQHSHLKKLDIYILAHELPHNIQAIHDLPTLSWREKYAALIGYAWHIQMTIEKHLQFASNFEERVLRTTYVAKKGDLPDDLALHSSCVEIYKNLQIQFPELLKDFTLMDVYCEVRNNLLDNLRTKISSFPADRVFYEKCSSVVKAIEIERCTKGEVFDKPFYINLLKKTAKIANDPTNVEALNEYKKLAYSKKVSGQRSIGKLVGGAMLTMIGVVVTALSTAAFVLSLGISAKITGPLIGLGVFTTLAGMALFKNGMRKGISHSMFAVTKSPPTFSQNKEVEMRQRRSDSRSLSTPLLTSMRVE